MLKALWSTFVEIADSKKAVTAIVAATVAGLGHFGLHVDPIVILAVISPLLAYIVAQAHVDASKAKGAAPANDNTPTTQITSVTLKPNDPPKAA